MIREIEDLYLFKMKYSSFFFNFKHAQTISLFWSILIESQRKISCHLKII